MRGLEQVIEGFRLSPQQRQVWRLQRDGQAYIAQCAILIEGDLESEALEAALKKVTGKHEIRRTVLEWFPGLDSPIQLILENPPLAYRRVDLGDQTPERLDVALDDLFKEEAHPFDLKRGLLSRFCLAKLPGARQVLLISLHALCADSQTLK